MRLLKHVTTHLSRLLELELPWTMALDLGSTIAQNLLLRGDDVDKKVILFLYRAVSRTCHSFVIAFVTIYITNIILQLYSRRRSESVPYKIMADYPHLHIFASGAFDSVDGDSNPSAHLPIDHTCLTRVKDVFDMSNAYMSVPDYCAKPSCHYITLLVRAHIPSEI